jgi:UDP-glucose 6-dehydrogenase
MGPFDGMCFPKDTNAFLSWAKEELKLPMDILSAMIEENEEMSRYYPHQHKFLQEKIRTNHG